MFEVGDVVCCVDVLAPCCGDPTKNQGSSIPQPAIKSTYRVAATGYATCRHCGEEVEAFTPTGWGDTNGSWPQQIFAKLPPAEPEFISLIRGLKAPNKIREDA